MNTIPVTVCGVPYELSIVDGGAMFSNKSGFYGVSGRFMFEYKSHLWYLVDSQSTWSRVALCHLVKMDKLLSKHIGQDHTEADGSTFRLEFKEVEA